MLPDVLASVVRATEAASAPLAEIDRLSIIGGAGDAQHAVEGLLGVSPLAVATVVEALKTSGIDVAALLNRSPDSSNEKHAAGGRSSEVNGDVQ